MENFIVLFGENGGRVYKGEQVEKFRNDPNALLNPILPRGTPPHLWRREGNQIVTVAQASKARRLRTYHRRSLATGIAIGSTATAALAALGAYLF